MSKTVRGIYRDGQIQLLETPEGVREAEVVVTFPDAVHDDDARRTRRLAAVKWLREHGWDLGGAPYPTRDELHDRTR